jgi:hypothetical protein
MDSWRSAWGLAVFGTSLCDNPLGGAMPTTPYVVARQLAVDDLVDIIPIDIVNGNFRYVEQHSGILARGLLQQRLIHHGYATNHEILYFGVE